MNVILLTPIIFILAPVASVTFPSRPCQGRSEIDKYNEFTRKHILQRVFDFDSTDAWAGYLREKKLCSRNGPQSFINKADEENVLQICSRACWHLRDNLCISRSSMTVYDVQSYLFCTFIRIQTRYHPVIVACNMIGSRCLPVHYEKYKTPNLGSQTCI